MKRIAISLCTLFLTLTLITSCDEHVEGELIGTIKPGMILCADGSVRTYDDMVNHSQQPTAVVFHVKQGDENMPGVAYAVSLQDITYCSFSDTVGSQGTSADITAYDGNMNTHKIYTSSVYSSMADIVYNIWYYGQSAYIPSVAEITLLYKNREQVNRVLETIGGEKLASYPDSPKDCWYWTSTEVKDQEPYKAWLYSFDSGQLQETPKEQRHRIRPIVTIYTAH